MNIYILTVIFITLWKIDYTSKEQFINKKKLIYTNDFKRLSITNNNNKFKKASNMLSLFEKKFVWCLTSPNASLKTFQCLLAASHKNNNNNMYKERLKNH